MTAPSTSTDRLVVASVPGDHVYIRHLGPEDGSGPVRLRDPAPDGTPRSAEQQWWPPVMLEPRWVAEHPTDLVHVHFGFDSRTPAELTAFVAALRERGRPLVFTVHDLRNPHHADRAQHDAQLDVLVPAADGLVTLTPGAAAEIERRWGRRAVVIPHPHVVELAEMERRAAWPARPSARPPGEFRVGLHLKSLRACMDPLAVLPVLVETVAGLPGAVLQLNAHRELVDAAGRHHDPAVARALRRIEPLAHVDLRVHDYLAGDQAFVDYLAGLDVTVLAYRFGTHSGWLEAARDLGTTVVAPSCGFYAEQGPVLGYKLDEDGFDAESLATAVMTAYAERPALGATVAERREQRAGIARAHGELYRSVTEVG